MKEVFFLCAILALVASKPNGYYHQEYNYKSSSSSFKNNELQHKSDDQGFYSKDGDLEGRLKPKVDSHSQHSEYTNPRILSGSSTYQGGGSSGNYLASSDRLFGTGQNAFQTNSGVDGYASSDRVLDLSNMYRGQGSSYGQYGSSLANQGYGATHGNLGHYGGQYGSGIRSSNTDYTQGSSNAGYAGSSSYGYMQSGSSYGSSGSYGSNANLNSLSQRLQDDMARQLEMAIQNQYRSSGYTTSVSSSQMTSDLRALEDELKRNLTRQLEDSIRSQYGQQVIRGSNSYTLVNGRPSTVVNFNNQELADLTRRMENSLVNKLHQDIQTTYRKEMNTYLSSNNGYQQSYTSTTLRPNYDRPVLIVPNNIRYTPVSNPVSITQIASTIQTDVNSYLDTALSDLYSRYIQSGRSNIYTLSDFDNEVHRIKNEILRNLTASMDDQIRRNYGHQVLKGDYYYSVSSNGDTSSQYNYNSRDYENLRKQVEDHLIRKLNQTVETYKTQYQRQLTYSTSTSAYTTGTYRPTYYTVGDQTYDYSDVQRRLSQQLQNALNQHRYSQSSSYSASQSYNPQAYQTSLDALTRELQRNLTEQLNGYRTNAVSSNSYGYSSGGSSNFEAMKNQLQNQLMQQLQQGLQKQHRYSASASYSASSSAASGSGYGSHQSYGNYENFVDCCQPIGTSGYASGRSKRDLSYNSYASGRSSQHSYASSHSSSRRSYSSRASSQEERGGLQHFQSHGFPSEPLGFNTPSKYNFQLRDSDSSVNYHSQNKQFKYGEGHVEPSIVEDVTNAHHSNAAGDDQQLVQQLEDDSQHLELHSPLSGNNMKSTGEDSTQQQLNFGLEQQLQLGLSNSYPKRLHEQSNIDLNQLQLHDISPYHNGNYYNHHTDFSGQQLEEAPTQQLELSGQEHLLNQRPQNHDDLTQQLELENVPKIKLVKIDQQLQQNNDLNQELENTDAKIQQVTTADQELQGQDDLTQQLELIDSSKPKHESLDQQLQDELTQQSKLTNARHPNQNVDQQLQEQDDLTQQLELIDSGKAKLEPDQQLQIQNDLTRNLEVSGSNKPIRDNDQQLVEANEFPQQLDLGLENKPKQKQLQQQIDQELELTDSRTPKLNQDQQLELTNSRKPEPQHQDQQVQQQDDLTQQLELTDPITSKPTQEQQLQQQEDLNQQQEDLNQQQEDLNQQLELVDSRKPKQEHIDQQLTDPIISKPTQEQQPQDQEELNQQLELVNSRKPKQEHLDQQLEDQNDLTQQLELTDSTKPKHTQDQQPQEPDDLTQQLDLSDATKPKYDQQPVEPDDLTQLELTSSKKSKLDQELVEQGDLNQQLESIDSRKPKQIEQQLQNQDELDQQLELTGLSKPKLTQNQQPQLPDDLTQQQELDTRKPKHDQHPDDLTQQLELIDSGKSNQKVVDQEIQTQEELNQPHKPKHDLTQQLELEDVRKPKQKTLDQQLEQSNKHDTNKKLDDQKGQLELEQPNIHHNERGINQPEASQLDNQHDNHNQQPLFLEFCAKVTYIKEEAKNHPLQQIQEHLLKPLKVDLSKKQFDLCKDELESRKDQLTKVKARKDLPKVLEQIITDILHNETREDLLKPKVKKAPTILENNLEQLELTKDQTQQTNVIKPCNQEQITKIAKTEPFLVPKKLTDQEVENLKSSSVLNFGDIIPSNERPGLSHDFNQQTENSQHHQLNPQYRPEHDFEHQSPHSTSSHNYNHEVIDQSTSSTGYYGTPDNHGSTHNSPVGFERPFTNGHSEQDGSYGHRIGLSTSRTTNNNFEDALKQQDDLLNLLRQKVQSNVGNQVSYGHSTSKNSLYVDGERAPASDFHHSSPNYEIADTHPILQTHSFPQQSFDSHFGTFEKNPEQHITRQSSYLTHTGGSSYSVNGNPVSVMHFPYHGHLSPENSHSQQPSPAYFGNQGSYNNGLQRTEYSGQATRRIIHYVNGKPVSASENVQILKPNGQIVETNHNLPLDEHMLNGYTPNMSHGGFSHSVSHPNLSNYGTQSSTGQTRRTYYMRGSAIGSSERGQFNDFQSTLGNYSPLAVRTLEKQIREPLEHVRRSTQPSSTYGIKTTIH